MNEFLIGAMVVGVVILVTIVILSRSGSEKRNKHQSPADILAEVEIFEAYGRTEQAIEKLTIGVAAHPDDQSLRSKLDSLST